MAKRQVIVPTQVWLALGSLSSCFSRSLLGWSNTPATLGCLVPTA